MYKELAPTGAAEVELVRDHSEILKHAVNL